MTSNYQTRLERLIIPQMQALCVVTNSSYRQSTDSNYKQKRIFKTQQNDFTAPQINKCLHLEAATVYIPPTFNEYLTSTSETIPYTYN